MHICTYMIKAVRKLVETVRSVKEFWLTTHLLTRGRKSLFEFELTIDFLFWINFSVNRYSSQFLMTWSTLLQIQHIAGWWGRQFNLSFSSNQAFYKEYIVTEEGYFDLYRVFSICQQFLLNLELSWVPHLIQSQNLVYKCKTFIILILNFCLWMLNCGA